MQFQAFHPRGLLQPQRFPQVFHAEALFNWAIVPSILFTRWLGWARQLGQRFHISPASGEEDVVAPEETEALEIAHDEAMGTRSADQLQISCCGCGCGDFGQEDQEDEVQIVQTPRPPRLVPEARNCPRMSQVCGSGKTPCPPRGILCKQDDQDSKMLRKLALQEHMRYIESLRQLLRGQLPHAWCCVDQRLLAAAARSAKGGPGCSC